MSTIKYPGIGSTPLLTGYKKTSEEWSRIFSKYRIIDPDGWDRDNLHYSFFKEKISLEEYNNRLIRSTIMIDD